MSFLYKKCLEDNPDFTKKEILDFMAVVPGASRTKQSFADDCDINKILKKAQISGSLDHLSKYEGTYGDFSGFDFHESQTKLAEGIQIFSELPSELRNEFDNNVGKFFEFVNSPENVGNLEKLMPALAEPGSYFPDMSSNTPPDATKEPKSNKIEKSPESEKTEKSSESNDPPSESV